MEGILAQADAITPVLAMGLGFAVGLEHSLEPDHVAALSTQISRSKISKSMKSMIRDSMTRSSMFGALWGAGHTTTLVLIGFLSYALAITIQDKVFAQLELAVGAMLVFLGFTTILNKKVRFRHRHPHQHKDGTIHLDEHTHDDSNHHHGHRSYFIGMIHGLAGSGGLIVLTSTIFDSIEMSLGFIVVFGIGSMIGMSMVGSLLGIPLVLENRTRKIKKIFNLASGVFSLAIGLNIIYHIGIIASLPTI